MWYKSTVIKEGQHGLQVGEVGSPCRQDQHGMKKFSVYLLGVQKVVHSYILPLHDCHQVFDPFLFKEMYPVCMQVPMKTKVWDFFPKGNGLGGLPMNPEK